jgi:uncharacterized protein YlxP (DUF503 family)
MPLAILNLHLQLPGCSSLKEKRSRIRPILARLHREFNVSTAEMDRLDHWHEAILACAVVSNDAVQCQRVLQSVLDFTEKQCRDVEVFESRIEIIP